MTHLPNLIIDLALILGAAAFITLLFKWLKQPLVLGYIIAGFLVGPYFKWLPTIQEHENIRIWAEVGVIFLLFSLGLEFSFKKLLKVGGSASITAFVEVVVMVFIGYAVGKAMGWSSMDSLFLGGILSISSTTIIIRAFDELGMKTKQFASLVFGVLIVEDLVAIVLMVLLSTLAVSQQFAGTEMLYSILKLILFLVIWFVMGIFFIPSFLRKAKRLINDEMLLIISIALCLLMVVFANTVGFSPALGAFIMGSILAETTKAEKIEHLVMPVKDLFGAIFFVSVGMMIDPSVLVEYALPIAILCVVTIIGKVLSTTFGALLSGQPLQTSVQAGFSLAQIGEFSFIIATLGLTLKVTSDFLYPIAVAVSAVTTLTTPYLIRSSGGFYQWLSRQLPQRFLRALNRYSSETKKATRTSQWKIFVRSKLMVRLLKLCVVVLALGFVFYRFDLLTGIIATAITILLLIIFPKRIQAFYNGLERRFFNNLNQREIATAQKNRTELAPWNGHIVPVHVLPGCSCVGKSLQELQWRESIGINVVMIKRQDHHIPAPSKEEVIYPGDELLVLGTDRQVQRLKVLMRPQEEVETPEVTEVELYEYLIPEHSALAGRTIRESGLREKAMALTVGVERNNERLLNPESGFELAANDILFIVGNRKAVKGLLRELEMHKIV